MLTALQRTTTRLPMPAGGGPMLGAVPSRPTSGGDHVELRPLVRRSPLLTAVAPVVQFDPPDQSPTVAPADLLGTVDYYRWRAADFTRRHPGQPVPAYYLGYGDKYAHRFSEKLAPQLSPDGQKWLTATRLQLQQAIEHKLQADPTAFARLEQADRAFTRFAYRTHPQAYLNAGITDLHGCDLLAIVKTPDLRDLISVRGIAQMAKVGGAMLERRMLWAGRQLSQEIAVAGRVLAPGAARAGSRGVGGAVRGVIRLL
ncbi:MAG: hypothetical protein H7338_21760 [Candidatus Sericytochromatia bacterium]|nr:hypothetical protein [Candidatus Sericytochromatia bacterium]